MLGLHCCLGFSLVAASGGLSLFVVLGLHAVWGFSCFGADFPGGSDGKASVYNVGDLGLIPGPGRFPGEGNGNPLQYPCLENPMDGGAWCRLLSLGSQRVGYDWVTSLSFFLLFWSMSSRRVGFHSCRQWVEYWWLPGSRAQAQKLRPRGLVAPQYLESSRTRDRTGVPRIQGPINIYWATREVPPQHFSTPSLCMRYLRCSWSAPRSRTSIPA